MYRSLHAVPRITDQASQLQRMRETLVNRCTPPRGGEDTTKDVTLEELKAMTARLPDLDRSSNGGLAVTFPDMLDSHVECVRKSSPDPLPQDKPRSSTEVQGEDDHGQVILTKALRLYNQGCRNARNEPPLVMTRDDTSATKRLDDLFVSAL